MVRVILGSIDINRKGPLENFWVYQLPEAPPPPDDPPPPENPPDELLLPELQDPPEPPDENEKPPMDAFPLVRISFLAFLNQGVFRMYNLAAGYAMR